MDVGIELYSCEKTEKCCIASPFMQATPWPFYLKSQFTQMILIANEYRASYRYDIQFSRRGTMRPCVAVGLQ